MAETNKKKYKFGTSELDLDKYILNLKNNVDSYVQDRIKNGGWTEGQVQEFRNAHDRYISALQGQYDVDDERMSTDEFGRIRDSRGELNDTDQDDFLYNDKGERLSRADYDALKKRKQKNYKDFQASRYWADFANRVGKKMASAGAKPAEGETAFDRSKHGWVNWWSTVKNLDGGTNLAPYLDMDKVGENGKRARTNRAKAASEFVQEYRDWLKGKNLNYKDYAVDYNTLDGRLAALQQKWGDGIWDENDIAAAAQAGIDKSWLDGFFTELENPNVDQSELEAKKKADEDKAKAEAEDNARKDFFNRHYNNYIANRGSYHEDNPYYFGNLPTYADDKEFEETFKVGEDKNAMVRNWLANPWTNKDKRALYMILHKPDLYNDLGNGLYHIKQRDDIEKGRGLVYDSGTGELSYRFVGDISPLWTQLKHKWNRDRNPDQMYQDYFEKFEKGGNIEIFQYGGDFDFNEHYANIRKQGFQDRGEANGRTAHQQEAGERYINSDNANSQNPDAGFTKVELTRLASIGGDITSMIIGFAGGNIASAAVGAGSTFANLAADIADDSTSGWEVFKNAAFGLGMDIVGAIPVFGATGKMAKMAKTALKLAPKVMLALGAGSAVVNAPQYYNSWKKLVDTDGKVTVDDWRNIAASIQLLAGGTAAVARNKAVKNATKTDTVAMDFIDPATKTKQTRLFVGNDAKAIREANGNLEALKKATTGKFEDIKNMELDVTGQKDGINIPLLNKKIFSSEGTAGVYNVTNGWKGRYIERGQHWYDLTPDQSVSGASPIGKTIADAAIDKRMAPLVSQSKAVQRSMKLKDAKIASLESEIKTNTSALEAANKYTGKSSAEIEADLTRVRRAKDSGEFTNRKNTFDQRIKSGVLDEVDASGKVTQGKVSAALARNTLKRREINRKLATDQSLTEEQRKALNDELKKLKSKADKIKAADAKHKSAHAEDIKYLKENDPSQESVLQSALDIAKKHETNKVELPGALEHLKARLANWQKLNNPNFHSAAYTKLKGEVKGDGTIEFKLNDKGDTVTRKWDEILKKYRIKYREGGKFQLGGGINNTRGTGDWYRHMYDTDEMRSWLANFNTANYKEFNDLQDSWLNNKKDSKYDPSNSDKTGLYLDAVKERQKIWHSKGLNVGIQRAQTYKELTGQGTDNKDGNFTDGWFGRQEYLRNGGTELGWQGHERELKALQEEFKKKGLEYYNDNGIFKLRLLQNPNGNVSPEETPKEKDPSVTNVAAIEQTHQTDNGSQYWNPNMPFGSPMLNVLDNPNAIANARMWMSDWYNKNISNIDRERARTFFLKNPFTLNRYVQGDLRAIERGQNSAGQLYHLAQRPQTSDGALQSAIQLDSAVKGQQFINEGLATDDAARKQSEALNWEQMAKNALNIHDTAEGNREKQYNAQRELLGIDEMEQSKKFTNHDTRMQELEYDAKVKNQEKEALQDKFALSDIHNYVVNNTMMQEGVLSPEEKAVWEKVMINKEVSPAKLDSAEYKLLQTAYEKASQLEQEQLAQYYKVTPSRWHQVRRYSKPIPQSDWEPNDGPNFSTGGWDPQLYKDGSKIEIQKLRNKSKDADRFQKGIQKHIDRNEKALDRLAKYSKKRATK